MVNLVTKLACTGLLALVTAGSWCATEHLSNKCKETYRHVSIENMQNREQYRLYGGILFTTSIVLSGATFLSICYTLTHERKPTLINL